MCRDAHRGGQRVYKRLHLPPSRLMGLFAPPPPLYFCPTTTVDTGFLLPFSHVFVRTRTDSGFEAVRAWRRFAGAVIGAAFAYHFHLHPPPAGSTWQHVPGWATLGPVACHQGSHPRMTSCHATAPKLKANEMVNITNAHSFLYFDSSGFCFCFSSFFFICGCYLI